jgi:glycogen(starch) synthase
MSRAANIERVLMTADPIGGVFTYVLDLARGLREYGTDVALATMGAPLSPTQRARARAIPGLDVYESSYKLEWMRDPWRDVHRAGDWLLTLENRIRPGVVHVNGYAHSNLPWKAPHLIAAHSCVLSWWAAVKKEQAPEEWNRYREVVRRGLARADLVVAPSRAMLSQLDRYYGPLRRTEVIPNGRSDGEYRPGVKEPFVLAAGRLWDEAKNLAALANVRTSIDWPICVAGDDRHPEGSAPAAANLHHLGILDATELAGYYSRAAIYCLPARYEPFGLSVLEAALSGCALVLGDIPSLRENWQDAAEFVSPDDVEALTGCLRKLISNPSRTRTLGELARERSRSFPLAAMVRAYVSAYSRLAVGEMASPVARA